MTLPPIVKQPHYVWRYYLQAWEHDKKLFAFRDGIIFPSKAAKVAKEGGFHDLRRITKDDEAFLLRMMRRFGSPNQEFNAKFVDTMVVARRTCEIVLNDTSASKEAKTYAKFMLKNFEEKLQGDLEILAIPWLNALRNGDASFAHMDENRLYYHYLTTQYFRTKRMMTKMVLQFSEVEGGIIGSQIERVWQIMRHLLASTVGSSLYAEKDKYCTVFFRTSGQLPFITGAQPIVNTHRPSGTITVPEDIEFYYPLTPNLAMLYTKKSDVENEAQIATDDDGVDRYNRMIIEASPDYFFGSDKATVERYAAELKK